jgi:hypothetical protein
MEGGAYSVSILTESILMYSALTTGYFSSMFDINRNIETVNYVSLLVLGKDMPYRLLRRSSCLAFWTQTKCLPHQGQISCRGLF